jgi:hypothetical protein
VSTKILSACVLMAAASACAKQAPPPQSPQPGGSAEQQAAPNRNRDMITNDELQAPGIVGLSVLDAVRSLRPQFLTVRGLHSPNDDESGKVHSSIDGNKVGPLDELSVIRASTVKEIRYLNPAAAHQKFGPAAHEGPVILVTIM